MGRSAFLGSFDAERYWREPHFAKLPEINDATLSCTVAAMDELLFPLCDGGNLLVTRFAMEPALKDYLERIGFQFENNVKSLEEPSALSNSDSIFELLVARYDIAELQKLFAEVTELSVYAHLPATAKLGRRLGLNTPMPDLATVKKVNSKVYSHQLSDQLSLKQYGTLIQSSSELEAAAATWFGKGGLVIKDPFGVSGKGNLVITSAKMVQRISRYLAAQEKKNLQTCFLVEPFLDKQLDFSCQLRITPEGATEILSIQTIFNTQFAYAGSMTAETEWVNDLRELGYFEIINRVAAQLSRDGYFGDVCIDSMRLQDGEIVPIVEVNARKSMGLINYHLDRFLARFEVKGYFCFWSVGFSSAIGFEELMEHFEAADLLFKPERGWGIIPLASNPLFANRDADFARNVDTVYKGRLYLSIAASLQQQRSELIERVKQVLGSLGFTIYNLL